MPATGRTIVFLSDFGYRNEWVGICHAVINRIAPASPIVDLSHGIPPLDVRGLAAAGDAPDAATLVAAALPEPAVDRGKIECGVRDLSRIGNVLRNVREAQQIQAGLSGAGEIRIDASCGAGRARRVASYTH